MPIISPKIPSGLEELMRGLAKSCIKENPENIYTFAAEYFENLLKERDGTVDQSYKKFATYKVYKKNKSARLKRGKENSNDVNDVPSDNGFKRVSDAVNCVNFERKDSVEEIVLPEDSQPLQALSKSRSSISSESEKNVEAKQEASVEIEGALSQENDDDDVKNMVLDEDMANAALKIQASFRGHKVRREMKDAKLECDEQESLIGEQLAQSGDELQSLQSDAEVQSGEEQIEAEKRFAGDDNEMQSEGVQSSDEQIEAEIQSGEDQIEGDLEEIFEPQAEIKELTKTESQRVVESEYESEGEIPTEVENCEEIDAIEESLQEPITVEVDDDIANMVLDDEMAEAALKIQATFRGHKVRREIKTSSIDNAAKDVEELMQTTDTQEEAPGVDENEALEGGVIVDESEQIEVEDIEEGKFECAPETTAEEIEIENETNEEREIMQSDSEAPLEMEEMLQGEDAIDNSIDVQKLETAIECDNEENPSYEPLETEEIAEITENVYDASIKGDVSEEIQADTEQTNGNAINDEAITVEENINEVEALSAEATQSVEAVDESLIESSPSVEAIESEKSTTEDCKNTNETLPEEVENVDVEQDEEKQISDETKFERPPTIENELNSIEQAEELSPGELQDETIKASLDNDEKLETEQSVVDEATIDETTLNERVSIERSMEEKAEDVIELTDNFETNNVEGENVNESENCFVQPQENEPFEIIEVKNVDVNEQEPQEGLNEMPNENETTSDDIDGGRVPVVEEKCEKKSFGMLEPDQENLESEIVEFPLNEIGKDEENVGESESGINDNLEKLPSGEVEYSPLKESMSVSPADSVDEVDNKSRDLTDEKSIDNDTEGENEIQEDVNEQLVADKQQKNESVVHSSTVDEIESLESILQTEVSPIELMDEIVNECAGVVAEEIFNAEPVESNFIKSVESENAENKEAEIVEPKLMEENPLRDIVAPKSIDLTQESIQLSQDEMEPIIDEILQPEGVESEIPEETQAPMDENMPTVTMQENSPSLENDEQMPRENVEQEKSDEKSEEEMPQVKDDVFDMVLDEEMEDAALKIQAAFRGHKVRKQNTNEQTSDSLAEEENTNEEESQKVDSNIVIDQCSEENVKTQDNEENEQQDTSADCEEIQESETVDQEETQEEPHEEAKTEEDETAVDETNETNEQGDDDPDGTPEEGESAEQNDDDDVTNMVLDEEMAQAALKIQSTFRGHKTRKDMKKDETEAQTSDEQPDEKKESTEELDDDIKNMVLDDEMEQAALKIQSTFRGHKTRQDMKKDDETVDDEADKETKEEEEVPPKEEEPEQSSSTSTEKTAKELQDEEDIAGLVMDSEMEKTALKIQSAFRGKKGFGKKAPKDGDESSASSAGDQQSEDELPENESPVKSLEDDPFQQNEQSSQEQMGEKSSYDDEKGSDYSAAQNSSPEGNQYSVERYNTSYEYEPEPMAAHTSTDDINLMQGGGIFPEPSGESSEMLTGSSGEERDPDRNSSYEKVPSDKSYEIDDPITSEHESVDPLNDEKVIENFDFVANKDTAEAMYYSLKKNEIETQKQFSMEKQLSMESNPTEDNGEKQKSLKNQSEGHDNEINENEESEEDDDDVVVGLRGPPPSSAKRLKYGMSMDDRLLGSILSQDYTAKARKEDYPDDGFDPMLEAAMRNHHFLEKLHEVSNSDEDRNVPYNDFPDGVGDEDQFDDFYNSNNIRQKIMASSISIADSDYFDPMANKSIIDDDKIRTALETIHSTDSESTIGSAATKIPVAIRRNNNITTHSMQYSSIGNAAIDKSLDEFIQSQEHRIDQFDEEMEGNVSPPPRKQESGEWTDDTTTYTDSDKKLPSGGIIEIKLEQKSFLTIDERRRTLHREDAIQRNSTRESDDSSKCSNVSGNEKNSSTVETVMAAVPQDSIVDTEITVPVVDLTEKSKSSSQSQATKPHRMKRQHTMPVQIQTDVIRVIPKHLRKRIKSADGEKKKRFSK